MARIELINLEKVFGEQKAVRALNLTVADGELVVLLGPSGCGKSTTMNMIAGLLPPSSGSIVFDGRDVTDGRRFSATSRWSSSRRCSIRT